jgi:hypothetical protein
MEILSQANHREWLSKLKGERVQEQDATSPMPGLEYVPIDGLVVSDEIDDEAWKLMKQNIIPLAPDTRENEDSLKAARQLKTLRAQLNTEQAFLALIQDEQIGEYEGDWVLAVINPTELSLPIERLRSGMEASYSAGDLVGGSSSRAALLAVTGEINVN